MQQQDQDLKTQKILVIEDVPTMRELICWMLKQIPGVTVSDAVDSIPAARLVLDRRRPDLVLLDRVLPGPLGDDLIPYLKSQNIPYFVLVTSDTQSRVGLGSEPILVKPFGESTEDLEKDLARIRDAIVQKRG
ncbi:MAG: response regulator [Bdellovibrionales bacterium]|nr:response regulator [Bdellovibrionales bacterium]